jgi:hypothetical protein
MFATTLTTPRAGTAFYRTLRQDTDLSHRADVWAHCQVEMN